jgi:hypothetical protein
MLKKTLPLGLAFLFVLGCDKNSQVPSPLCISAKFIAKTCYPIVQIVGVSDRAYSSWSSPDSTYYNVVGIPDLPARFETGEVFILVSKLLIP